MHSPSDTKFASDNDIGISACCGSAQVLSVDKASNTGVCCDQDWHWSLGTPSASGACCQAGYTFDGINCVVQQVAPPAIKQPSPSSPPPSSPNSTPTSAPGSGISLKPSASPHLPLRVRPQVLSLRIQAHQLHLFSTVHQSPILRS